MADLSIHIQASRPRIDDTIMPFVREKVPALPAGVKVRLNQPLDLTVEYPLDADTVIDVDLRIEEVAGEATFAAFPGH